MMTEQHKVRLIFAFKVKYFRLQKKLSYQLLSELTGLSTSYLHDIEKGKKYPKIGKIQALAKAFEVDYNDMVSTKASKKIQPIIDLLNSDFLKVFPLELFGISLYKLFELFSTTPDKVNAFISTIIKITRNYQMRNEHFYSAALRSYQDMHDNYFEELESAVKDFQRTYKIKSQVPYQTTELEALLKKYYDIHVDREQMALNNEFKATRSYFSNQQKILYLNKNLKSSQENFLLARELAFQYLELEERPYITRILEVDSFEKLLNNFNASYFAAALLMDEDELTKDFKRVSKAKKWSEKPILNLLDKYDVSPEMLFQRLTNILPKHFGVKDLFFLRISGDGDLKKFRMTKEIHLSQLHNPYGNVRDEHYCRRWISINILKRLRASRAGQPIADAQISKYWETTNEYLCLSIAKPDEQQPKASTSVTIGLLMNPDLLQVFGYLDDPGLKKKEVDTTCERCSMPNCGARATSPIVVEERERIERIKDAFKTLQ